jgi:hypothetical protein
VNAIAQAEVGQLWRDEDGLKWRIVALNAEWVYVKRHGYPRSQTIQTNPGWLARWVRES